MVIIILAAKYQINANFVIDFSGMWMNFELDLIICRD